MDISGIDDKALERSLEEAVNAICVAFSTKKKLLICGNGGSAADSSHIAGELVKSFEARRPLPEALTTALRSSCERGVNLSTLLERGFPAISLASDGAVMSAIINDIGQEAAFAQQVSSLGQEGDVLMCISTSGGSENVINAAVVGKALGMKVIALTGNASELSELCDIILLSGGAGTAGIQSRHQSIYHEMCRRIEKRMG